MTKSREALLAELENKPNIDRQMLVLQELLKREGEDFQTSEGTIKDTISFLYQKAAYDRKWSAVRRGAGLLKKLVDSLAPGITTILVSGKVVSCNFGLILTHCVSLDGMSHVVPPKLSSVLSFILKLKLNEWR